MASLCLVFYALVALRVASKQSRLESQHLHQTNHALASNAGVYGIAGPSYEGGEDALVKYDTVNGNASTVNVPNTRRPPYTGQNLGCLDNIHDIFFFLYEHWTIDGRVTALYPFDLRNTTEYDPVLLPIASNTFLAGDQCTTDINTGDIYVFGHDVNNELYQLLLKVTFDTANKHATIDVIGNYSLIDDIPLISDAFNIYDTKRNMLWFAGEYGKNESNSSTYYFYINAKTGAIEKKIAYESVAISNAIYSPNIDRIVGVTSLGYNDKGWLQLQMLYADPQTLETVRSFTPFTGNDWSLYESVYTMDDDGGILYNIIFSGNDTLIGHLVGVDVKGGFIVSEPRICKIDYSAGGDTDTCPWSIQYWNGTY